MYTKRLFVARRGGKDVSEVSILKWRYFRDINHRVSKQLFQMLGKVNRT